MKTENIGRRDFIKRTGIAVAGAAIAGSTEGRSKSLSAENKLPRWRGFNLLDFFAPQSQKPDSQSWTTTDDLKWISDWGFDFVRLPMAYPRYIKHDPSKDITVDQACDFDNASVDRIEELVRKAISNGLHVSLNLHRAPGYCINAGFHEPFNLWKDSEAREAFNNHWSMWAGRFRDIPSSKLSFDLLNEPAYIEDMNDQFAHKGLVPGDVYRKVAEGAAAVIRSKNPGRLIIADGNSGGNNVIPELEGSGIAQSCRGYWPGAVSHYQAPWVFKDPSKAPVPVWPGTIEGKYYGREQLEEFYKPWIELKERGTGVHCGECGCWRNTPHDIFLAWFSDVTDILTRNGIGYALWNFRGDFGILDSGRADVNYTDWYGHKLDKKLLDLLKKR